MRYRFPYFGAGTTITTIGNGIKSIYHHEFVIETPVRDRDVEWCHTLLDENVMNVGTASRGFEVQVQSAVYDVSIWSGRREHRTQLVTTFRRTPCVHAAPTTWQLQVQPIPAISIHIHIFV